MKRGKEEDLGRLISCVQQQPWKQMLVWLLVLIKEMSLW